MLHKNERGEELQHIAEMLNKLSPEGLELIWQFVQQLLKAHAEKEDA